MGSFAKFAVACILGVLGSIPQVISPEAAPLLRKTYVDPFHP